MNTSIKEFSKLLENDAKSREDVIQLGFDKEAIVAYANGKGYEFTIEELKEAQPEKQEIDMESLEQVSGGTRAGALVTTITAIGVVFLVSE